jgi:hypothetical protein
MPRTVGAVPEPIDPEYLRTTQRIVADAPVGPWTVEPNEHGGLPDQVGPIAFLETWVDSERLSVVEFISHAREALPRYVGEVSRQRDEIESLRRRMERLERGEGGESRGR